MTITRQAGYATAVGTLPVVVWLAGSLFVEAVQPGGAARASARIAPMLPVTQLFALALLIPALCWRQTWRRSCGIAALIAVAPWPMAVLLAQTGGVTWFGLGVGQFAVTIWALAVVAATRVMARDKAPRNHRLSITQGALIVGAALLARGLSPVFAGMVTM